MQIKVMAVKSSGDLFVIFIAFLSLSVGLVAEGQTPFHVYKLDTQWDTNGADISPDSRFVAVEASKGSKEGQSIELVNEIQVWDFRNGKPVASKVLSREKFNDPHDIRSEPQFVRYADAGTKIVVCQLDHLLLLDSKTLDQLQSVDLGKAAWPRFPPDTGLVSYVGDVEIDQRGNRAAVLLEWGAEGGELRIYDLGSGNLMRKWSFPNYGFGGISMDPKGARVAISLLPFSPGERPLPSKERNVFVYDVNSGEITSESNTGYLAAEVRFVENDTLATVSAETGLGGHKKDGIRLWDVKTGRLLREILSPSTGVRYHLEVSEDGKTALGYVAKEVNHWWWFDPASVITEYERFRLWDLATGGVIATSPDLPNVTGSDLALSPKGDVVLVYRVATGDTLVFYELR